jgi:hypothetical protein
MKRNSLIELTAIGLLVVTLIFCSPSIGVSQTAAINGTAIYSTVVSIQPFATIFSAAMTGILALIGIYKFIEHLLEKWKYRENRTPVVFKAKQ